MAKAEARLLCFLYVASLVFVMVAGGVGDECKPAITARNEPAPIDDISCREATTGLLPCLPFLNGSTPSPTEPCCQGVRTVQKLANTTETRRNLCVCFKKVGPGFGVKLERVKQIPKDCHIDLTKPIDPDVDCNTIPYGSHYKLEG